MGKISEIMLLKQPKQSALVVEVQTDMNGMPEAIGKNFVKIDSYLRNRVKSLPTSPTLNIPTLKV